MVGHSGAGGQPDHFLDTRAEERLFFGGGKKEEEDDDYFTAGYYDYHFDPHHEFDHSPGGGGGGRPEGPGGPEVRRCVGGGPSGCGGLQSEGLESPA